MPRSSCWCENVHSLHMQWASWVRRLSSASKSWVQRQVRVLFCRVSRSTRYRRSAEFIPVHRRLCLPGYKVHIIIVVVVVVVVVAAVIGRWCLNLRLSIGPSDSLSSWWPIDQQTTIGHLPTGSNSLKLRWVDAKNAAVWDASTPVVYWHQVFRFRTFVLRIFLSPDRILSVWITSRAESIGLYRGLL